MLKRLNSNPLFLFLAVGMLLLCIAFPSLKAQLNGDKVYRVIALNLQQQMAIPEQGLSQNPMLTVYNPAYTLLYSLDGGDHFFETTDALNVDLCQNPAILFEKTSIRWRHPVGDFPSLQSLVIKLRDEVHGTESEAKCLTYFQKIPSDLPIVHLTIAEDDLFDWDQGVMIYGESSSHDEGFQKDWWYRSANFAELGSTWAKKVHFHYFVEGQLAIEQACEMRISGNATRYFPQKSMKFYPLNEEGRRDKMNYPLWGEKGSKKSESFLLRHGGNDNLKTIFADLLMHDLADGANVMVQNGHPVSVYFNGNYWGIYNLRERVEDYFVGKEEGVPSDSITILYCEVYGDKSLLKSGSKADQLAFDQLVSDLSSKDNLSDEAYAQVRSEISTKSFIDYIFFETFYGNQDWLHNNTTWYKAGHKKWKWLLNDLDYSLNYPGATNLHANLFDELKNSSSITAQLFNQLMTVKKFKKKFKARASELVADFFNDERIDEIVNGLKSAYLNEIQLQINRWRMINSIEQWEKDVAENVTFLKNRRTIYLKQVEDL